MSALPIEPTIRITEPGVYGGIAAEDYHRDPIPGGSLSSSGIRVLTNHTPAHFAEWRRNPPATTATFNFGHAAHKRVLGEGAEMVTFPNFDGRTKEGKPIKAARDAAILAGKIAVTEDELAAVEAMAEAIKSHPLAMMLLDGERGESEQAMFWRDPETGVWCRSLADRLLRKADGGVILADYKTAESADPEVFGRVAESYGYHQQDQHYTAGAIALGLADSAPFVFIVQEKKPPFLVNVIQLDRNARLIGAHLNREAIRTYAECEQSGKWPGYGEDVDIASLPYYVERQYEEIL